MHFMYRIIWKRQAGGCLWSHLYMRAPLLSRHPLPSEPVARNHPPGLPCRTANGASGKNDGTYFLLGLRPRKSQGGDGKWNRSPCDKEYLLAPYWYQPSRDPGHLRTEPEIKLPFQDHRPELEYHDAAAARCQQRPGDWLGRHLGRTGAAPAHPLLSGHLPHGETSLSPKNLFFSLQWECARACTLT